jgi:phosphonate transport system ATP-binding protein
LLTIRDLRLVYPNGYEALKSVNLTVNEGEIVAVVGRSGAGKSTLLRCINGLEPITSGSVELDGQDVGRLSGPEMRRLQQRIGFIWQEYNLVERLSVITNVLCGRLGCSEGPKTLLFYFGSEHRRIAVRSLERVNMLHRARQRADRLSGGEKQRVAIARAVAQEPKLILADEPVASLDPVAGEEVMELFVSLMRRDGLTLFFTSHNLEHALRYADRVIGLQAGRMALDAPARDLRAADLRGLYDAG